MHVHVFDRLNLDLISFRFFCSFCLETLIVVVSVVVVAYGYSFCIQIMSTIIIVFILGSKNLVKIKLNKIENVIFVKFVNAEKRKIYFKEKQFLIVEFRIYLKYELSTNEQINKNFQHNTQNR